MEGGDNIAESRTTVFVQGWSGGGVETVGGVSFSRCVCVCDSVINTTRRATSATSTFNWCSRENGEYIFHRLLRYFCINNGL